MFEFFFKLLGPNMAALLVLVLHHIHWEGETLTLSAALANPVTVEIQELTTHQYAFDIQYYFSVIINNRKTYRTTVHNVLRYQDRWLVNGVAVDVDSIQARMGRAHVAFDGLRFDDGDEVQVFIQASIVDDPEFEASTGLKTTILWKYFEPKAKNLYVLSNGRFELK
jgi:hypothetical protein